MNKFYAYLLPIVLLLLSFGISTFVNNELVLYIGWVVSLIWLNRIAKSFQNKSVKILTVVLLVGTIAWSVALILWASAWY